MRIIGLDIHCAFAEAVAWDDGKLKRLGRVDMRRHLLEAFAKKLTKEDVVVVEATGNAASVAAVITPYVKKVVIANPKQVRVITQAKIKTDTIDAGVLAQLYASGFLPEVWVAAEPTQALRRQVTRRNQIVRQRSRLKNIIQSILHSHLIPSCPHADLCGASGRAWLFHQVLPEDERLAVERHLREFDRLGEDLKIIERNLARSALGNEGVKRLMTIPGVDMVVALAIVAAIGDVGRFEQSQKLVSYLGLNPSVRQSGLDRRITAGSPSSVAGMRAACSSRLPGRRRGRRVHCAHSSYACEPAAARKLCFALPRRWRRAGSLPRLSQSGGGQAGARPLRSPSSRRAAVAPGRGPARRVICVYVDGQAHDPVKRAPALVASWCAITRASHLLARRNVSLGRRLIAASSPKRAAVKKMSAAR
jgi:transposase